MDTPSVTSDTVSKTYGNIHILITCNKEGSIGGPMYGGTRSRTLVNDIIFNKKPTSKTSEPLAINITPCFTVINQRLPNFKEPQENDKTSHVDFASISSTHSET